MNLPSAFRSKGREAIRSRSSGLMLLILPGCLLLFSASVAGETGKAPARLMQLPYSTPEPPLAGQGSTPPAAPSLQPVPVVPLPSPPAGPFVPPPPAVPFVPPPTAPAPPLAPLPPPPLVKPVPPEPPVPVVAIRVRVPECGMAGCDLKYLICVENSSPAPAHHVLVRVPLPAGAHLARAEPPPATQDSELVWALGTLPGTCSKEIWLILVPTGTSDVRLCARVQFEHGQCVCTHIARAAPPFPGPVMPRIEEGVTPPSEKGKPTVKSQAKLNLKMNGPKDGLVGQPVTYTLTLTNTGSDPATNTLVTATFPEQMTFESADAGGRQVQDTVAWLLGTLEAGDSRTVSVTLKAKSLGKRCIKGGALADGGLTAKDEICTTFKGAAALRLKMVDTRDPIAVGEETSYVIEILSQGSLPVTNVQIKAVVPVELALVTAKGPTDYQPGPQLKGKQEIVFQPYPSLAPAERITYEVFVKGVRPGDARFRVTMTADQLRAGGPVFEEESTMIFQETAQAHEVRRRKGTR
jgi:uncharacterized repeat protein (TIGR01451 family)